MISLFSEYNNSRLRLKNRVVMPPMSRYACNDGGFPTQALVEYYLARAKFDVGLVIVEAASIDGSASKGYINGLSFYSRQHAAFWSPIVRKMHDYGATVFLQLYHAGRLTTYNVCHTRPIAPSEIAPMKQRSHFMDVNDNIAVHFQGRDEFLVPTEMSDEDIRKVQNEFAVSAELASMAGFDGVDLHAAHGNLIHQFSSKMCNRRNDGYGNDQYSFIRETVVKVKDAIAKDTLLSLRLSQHMVDSSFIRFSNDVMSFESIVGNTESMVDVFSCSEIQAGKNMFGHDMSLSSEIRKYTPKTIITSGQINGRLHAEELLNSGSTDLVAFGRLMISNPDLVGLFKRDAEIEIVPFKREVHSNVVI